MSDNERHASAAGLLLRAAVALVALVGGLSAARAQEIEPREFVPAPSGTNINIFFYLHGSNTSYYTTTGHKISNSSLDVNLGLERFVHYQNVGNMPAGVQILQLFGSESGGRVGGSSLGSTFGAANTALSAFIWPYANPALNQYLVVAGFLYPPVGSYDKRQSLNLASSLSGWQGWTGDLQIGWDQGIGPNFSYDASLDVRFFGDTTGPIQPTIPLSVRNHKNSDLRAQLWLNWAWTRAFSTSIGYEGFFGGESYFDNPIQLGGRGHTNTGASREHRLRAAASMFLSPQFQLLLEGNHDIARGGGFKQQFGLVLRTLYIF